MFLVNESLCMDVPAKRNLLDTWIYILFTHNVEPENSIDVFYNGQRRFSSSPSTSNFSSFDLIRLAHQMSARVKYNTQIYVCPSTTINSWNNQSMAFTSFNNRLISLTQVKKSMMHSLDAGSGTQTTRSIVIWNYAITLNSRGLVSIEKYSLVTIKLGSIIFSSVFGGQESKHIQIFKLKIDLCLPTQVKLWIYKNIYIDSLQL